MEKSFLFISCEEAKHICDKSQYGEATLWERFKLSIRLSWCKVTRAYTKRNRALTKTVKSSKVECLNQQEQQELRKNFDTQLKRQDQ
ncbi:MAG TPA: hypothetical protein VJ945_03690 [Flavobacteriaceae bacterium]|nr:hypothetical protein [Flavobacteriaceae bacterium]